MGSQWGQSRLVLLCERGKNPRCVCVVLYKSLTNHARTQQELMVQEICRDIKSLDYAKKHLTASILALRNLHMLVSAVDQFSRMAEVHACAALGM